MSESLRQIDPQTGICFFRTTNQSDLVTFLSNADFAPLPIVAKINEWLEYGCVYIDGQRWRENRPLVGGELIRLHTRLKRYAHPLRLSERIAFQNDEFLILDKPAGLPTHPTLDNYIENAKLLLERELGQTLYTTHRLDIPTQGLLILAKTPDGQRQINKLFAKGLVKKTYHAVCEGAIQPATYTHYMNPEGRAPRKVSLKCQPGWWECRLQVEQVQPDEDGQAYAYIISLLTGRTHQIRAQMAALGAPVKGDVAYGARAELPDGSIGLECYRLSFRLPSGTYNVRRLTSLAPALRD